MAEQYVASDKRTGLEVAVTGEFPPHHDDRIRIARTSTLFTRLLSTILSTENESQRRQGFIAVETQLELADALIREDMQEVQRLLNDTMEKMGITQEQLEEMAKRVIEQFGDDPNNPGKGPGPYWGDPPPGGGDQPPNLGGDDNQPPPQFPPPPRG